MSSGINIPSLSLLVKPASFGCNLECTYCFYKRVSEIYTGPANRMSHETASVMIRKCLSSNASRVSFCWQGGEPTLMGLGFFDHVVNEQKKHVSPLQSVENTLQTNGILLDDRWCGFLAENNFLVGISLDGPEYIHDRYRRFPNGQGTFGRVMDSIERMKRGGVEFNILVLLNDANVHKPGEVYRFMRENGFSYLQFIPCCEWDSESGEMLPFSVGGEDLGNFYRDLFDLWIDDGFPYVSIRLFEDLMIYWLDGVHLSCGWLDRCASYLLVEHNGDCYPCDFYVYPEWKIGNLEHEPLEAIWNSGLRRKFGDLKSKRPDQCVECQWFGFCHGDCIKFRKSYQKNSNGLSVYCVSWNMLLQHIESKRETVIKRARMLRAAVMKHPLGDYDRNGPCPCGSERKFKKCCGRGI